MRSAARARRIVVLLAVALGWSGAALSAGTEPVLNLMSWSEYFPASLLRRFERETGIHVNYATMDSNEVMETTLSAGHSGFDLVTVNASPHLAREIPKHLWQPLDKSRIRTLGNADPSVMRALRRVDPENRYAVPWMWGTVGVLYNPDLVGRIDGAGVPMIERIFRPALVGRYRDCGVLLLDSWPDVLPALSDWLGQPELTAEPAALAAVSRAFHAIRPSIRRVSTSGYYQQLAEGEACLALGYSGDAQIARRIAHDAGNGVRIEFAFPDGRVPIFVDSFAIPADAPHAANAHAFIEFAMRPENSAEVAAYIGFASGNSAAIPLLPAEVRDNVAIYPPAAVRARFTLGRVYTAAEERAFGRAWLRMKSGH